jgi:sugar-specific transcriptional regulator TrmB
MFDEYLDALRLLGLTEYQSKAYLGLLLIGSSESKANATAPMIAKQVGIPQPKIYNTLERLEERGLIQSNPERPKKYYALPPSSSLSRLLQSITQKVTKATTQLDEMFAKSYLLKDTHPDIQIYTTEETTQNILTSVLEKTKEQLLVAVRKNELLLQTIIGYKPKETRLVPKLLLNEDITLNNSPAAKKIEIKSATLPMDFLISNNTTLLINVQRNDGNPQLILTWNKTLVSYFSSLFKDTWMEATPWQ